MIRMIVAVSSNGVIGLNGGIPFHYSADMKNFKNLTLDSTVIMGRKTFESIGKPLPKRRNIVISKIESANGTLDHIKGIEVFKDIPNALITATQEDVWFIGGSFIYQEGMKYTEEIHLTITPDEILNKDAVKFPWIDPTVFKLESWKYFDDEPKLKYCIYSKI